MTAAPHPLRAAKNTALDLLRRPDLLLAFALANLAARLAVHEPLRLLGRQLLATILAPQPPRAWLRPLLLASLATIAALGLVGPALVALLHALRRRRPLDPKSFLAGPAAVVAASLAAATVAATLLLQGAVGWQLLAATVAQRSPAVSASFFALIAAPALLAAALAAASGLVALAALADAPGDSRAPLAGLRALGCALLRLTHHPRRTGVVLALVGAASLPLALLCAAGAGAVSSAVTPATMLVLALQSLVQAFTIAFAASLSWRVLRPHGPRAAAPSA